MALDILGITERRQTPRFAVDLSVDVVLEDGTILPVKATNISSSGLLIYCDSWVTDEIEPRGIQSHSVSHIRFKAIAELNIGDVTKKLYARCRITSVQRMSQDEFRLNLAFVDFENGSESVLDAFLDTFLQKKTVIKHRA